MPRFLTDEDFNYDITRGVKRERTGITIVRVQDMGLRTRADAEVLEWAAAGGYLLLTHDARTMPKHAYERLRAGLPMPGVFVVSQDEPVGVIVEEIITLAECSAEGEWEGQVNYLPLK